MITPRHLFGPEGKDFKEFLISEIGISEEDFSLFLELSYSSRSRDIVLKARKKMRPNYSSESELIIKRFKEGSPANLSPKLVNEINEEIEKARVTYTEKKRLDDIYQKAEKLVKVITEKYQDPEWQESEEKNESGFEVRFEHESTFQPIEEKGFYLEISYSPKMLSFKEQKDDDDDDDEVKRIDNAVVVTIDQNGNIGQPRFDLGKWFLQKNMKSLENIIIVSDACINWQIDITEFAEQIKSEVNPEFWKLAKEL